MLGRLLVLTLAIVVVSAGCASKPPPTEDVTLAYMKVLEGSGSATRQIGWLEVRGHQDSDGMRTIVSFVMDMDHHVRGYIRSEGHGVKYEDVAPAMANAIDTKRKYHELPKASREHLIRLILDRPVHAEISTAAAKVSDIRK